MYTFKCKCKCSLKQLGFLCHKDKLPMDKKALWQFHYFLQGRLTIQKTLQLPITLLPPAQRGKTPQRFARSSFCHFPNFGGNWDQSLGGSWLVSKSSQLLNSSLSTFSFSSSNYDTCLQIAQRRLQVW